MSKYGVISGPYFPAFGLSTGNYGPEKTLYLDTFHTVNVLFIYKMRCLFEGRFSLEGDVYLINQKSSVIRQNNLSQNGCFKKTKHAKFSKERTILTPWYAHVDVSLTNTSTQTVNNWHIDNLSIKHLNHSSLYDFWASSLCHIQK